MRTKIIWVNRTNTLHLLSIDCIVFRLFMDEQITTTKQLNEYLNGFRNRITDAFTKLDQIRARQ